MKGVPVNSKRFFEDNSRYINPNTDQVMHNINSGLLAIANEIEVLRKNQTILQHQLDTLIQSIQMR